MKSTFLSILAGGALLIGAIPASAFEFSKESVPEVKWDAQSLIIDGRRVAPVMGEIHYSRLPEAEWRDAVAR